MEIQLKMHDLILPVPISKLGMISAGDHIEHYGAGAEVERNTIANPQAEMAIDRKL